MKRKVGIAFMIWVIPLLNLAQNFEVPITVTDNLTSKVLIVGVSPAGSDSFDVGLDISAPPFPPNELLGAHLDFQNEQLYRDIRSNDLAEKYYRISYQTAPGRKIILHWNPETMSTHGTFTIVDVQTDTTFFLDMSMVDSLDVSTNIFISNELKIIVTPKKPFITINAKAFLQGPYDNVGMRTILKDYSLLPLSQPYDKYPWGYSGQENIDEYPEGIVDWILIELRTDIMPESKIATRAAFIRNDGKIVELDGINPVKFDVPPDDYYLVITHRNHLSIMSNTSISFSEDNDVYDFSVNQTQAYGANPMIEISNGTFGLRAGDGNNDGGVDILDKNLVWRPANGSQWNYDKLADYNLDGGIDVLDLNLNWRPNNGTATEVP